MNSVNTIFYSPNMIQFSARRPQNKPIVFNNYAGKIKMQNLNEDYKKFIEELKSKVNDNTIPEFGNFPPISVNTILKDDSALVFQVKSVDKYPQKKEFLTNFINAKTGGMVTSTRFFDDKKKLLEYINTIDDKALNKIVLNLKADTE